MLNRQPKDFDVATEATPEQIRRLFRNCRIIGRRFRLAHILFKNETIETSTFRAGSTTPEDTQQGKTMTINDGLVIRDNLFGTPEEDALRRDFTINALFYDPSDFTVIDHAGGLEDLKQRLIRVIGDPDRRFTEDPVRMIRAARFAGTLDFQIHQADYDSIRRNAPSLSKPAPPACMKKCKNSSFADTPNRSITGLRKPISFAPCSPPSTTGSKKILLATDWVIQALEQMDRWREAQLSIHPALLFSLIFGEYHETLISKKIEQGSAPFDAAATASTNISTPFASKCVFQKPLSIKSVTS